MTAAVAPGGTGLTERQSVAIVAVAHLVLLAGLSFALRSLTPPPPPDEGVPVEIVSAKEAKAATTPLPPPPAPAPTPPPQPAPPPKVEAPAPKPVDEAAPPEKGKPKPEKLKPESKPEPKPLDTAALSKLLDKAEPRPKTKPLDTKALAKALDADLPKTKPLDTAALAKSLDAALPRAATPKKAGHAVIDTGNLAQAIRGQVTPCWTIPVGGTGKMTVVLHLTFNRDGSVAGRPIVVGQTGVTSANAAYARTFAEAAARAVLRCAPLKLPPDQYDQWKAVEINFDPSEL